MNAAIVMAVINESDFLPISINYHRQLGIKKFIIMDLGSTDNTFEVLDQEARHGDIEILTATTRNIADGRYYSRMIEALNARKDLDFAFLLDADELLAPRDGRLEPFLAAFSGDVGRIFRRNALSTAPLPPTRAETAASLSAYTHVVRYGLTVPQDIDGRLALASPWILTHDGPKTVVRLPCLGRPEVGNHGVDGVSQRDVPIDDITIIHYPVRSVEQFKEKLREARYVLGLHPEASPIISWHWRRWLALEDRGELDAELERFVITPEILDVLAKIGMIVPNPTLAAVQAHAGA